MTDFNQLPINDQVQIASTREYAAGWNAGRAAMHLEYASNQRIEMENAEAKGGAYLDGFRNGFTGDMS